MHAPKAAAALFGLDPRAAPSPRSSPFQSRASVGITVQHAQQDFGS